jgi:BirA family biotin operon repressor/biotin-[acetyl-CoA-carboxylase] ligase
VTSLDTRLLSALRSAATHLPAGELAAQLGEDPAAIHARLAVLNEAGFEIENRPGLGVRLIATPDRLVADDLSARLGPCSLIREILVFAETDSTNNLAAQLGRQGKPGGVAVFAEHQTAGRGRFGRRWSSASHRGLWFSLLLRPSLPLAHWARLTTWAAVSVAAAIEESTAVPASIKWPNDVFVSGKKVSGILAESGTDTQGQPFAVVGIGINVNHEFAEFPPELQAIASSLRESARQRVDRPAFAATLLQCLNDRFPLLAGDFSALVAETARRSFLLGRWIEIRSGETVMEGVAEQLDADGHLLLRLADGSLTRLTAGEVTVIAR